MVWQRVLLLFGFSLFWGGLTFYTGFVVRISHDVLSDPMDGGIITQRVTDLLQWLGVLAFSLMAWNAIVIFKRHKKFGSALFALSVLLLLSLTGLFIVHDHLDSVIDVSTSTITDRDAFTIGHRRYNQLTTVEWLSSVGYLALTIFAWQRVDSDKTHLNDRVSLDSTAS